MATRLYVGNLSYQTTQDQIKELFETIAEVTSASLVIDRENGNRSKGFAFVEMATEEGAQEAIEKLNDQEIDGRKLVVNEARPRTDAPRTGGANRGGGDRGGFSGNRSW